MAGHCHFWGQILPQCLTAGRWGSRLPANLTGVEVDDPPRPGLNPQDSGVALLRAQA